MSFRHWLYISGVPLSSTDHFTCLSLMMGFLPYFPQVLYLCFGCSAHRYAVLMPVQFWPCGFCLFSPCCKESQPYVSGYLLITHVFPHVNAINVSGVPLIITQSYYLHKVTSGVGLPLKVTMGHPISFFSRFPLTITHTKLYQDSPHLWSHCV